jgi:hypothetical protein
MLNRSEIVQKKDKTINDDKYTKDDIKNNLFRLDYMNKIKEILGISSTFEKVNTSRDQINKTTKYFNRPIEKEEGKTERDYIDNVFNIDKNKQGKTELNFKKTLELLNLVMNHWNDSKIKKDRKGIYDSNL